jgi:hypothetical protein
MTTGTFAAAFVALYAAHMVADHVLQTDRQARGKAADKGWAAPMAGHLATYLAAQFLALFAVAHIAPFPATNLGVACGLGFSVAGAVAAGTHRLPRLCAADIERAERHVSG